jgi:tetraprenyl-beta-curcumene synthase
MQAAREIAAAASALLAYLTTVLPRVRRELRQLGPVPREKARNAEAVAVFATLAPRRHRAAVVRAIVALQVAIDLRDELEEQGEDAMDARLAGLQERWRRGVAGLPSHQAVRPWLEGAVERCEQAQLLTHRAARIGPEELHGWASRQQQPPEYYWWEVAAGATSSVAAHALIAAASQPATTATASGVIDAAYNPPIGALTVLLDDLVDLEEDRGAGEHNYLSYYGNPAEAADRLALLARWALQLLEPLPQSSRHRAILAGVAAFYLSSAETAPPIRGRLLSVLGPGTRVLVVFMRLRGRKRPGQAGNSPEP